MYNINYPKNMPMVINNIFIQIFAVRNPIFKFLFVIKRSFEILTFLINQFN